MLKCFAPLAVLGLLISAQPASSETIEISGLAEQQSPKELFEGATRMMMQALELLIKAVPQYDTPVMLPNGDIIIRRKRTSPHPAPHAMPPNAAPAPEDTNPDQDRI